MSKGSGLPRWVALVGLAAAAVSILSITALLWEPATLLLPLGRVLSYIWIVVSLLLARVPCETESSRRLPERECCRRRIVNEGEVHNEG